MTRRKNCGVNCADGDLMATNLFVSYQSVHILQTSLAVKPTWLWKSMEASTQIDPVIDTGTRL